jgi:hypothetical protein
MSVLTNKVSLPQGGYLNFMYSRMFTVNGERYFIAISDSKNVSYIFYLKQELGSWIIEERKELPLWVIGLENQFGKIICCH